MPQRKCSSDCYIKLAALNYCRCQLFDVASPLSKPPCIYKGIELYFYVSAELMAFAGGLANFTASC